MGDFLNSQLYADLSIWAALIVLAIMAWYAIPERVRRGSLRAGRYVIWLIELLGAFGIWLTKVIANLIRQVLWGAPQTLEAASAGGGTPAPVSRVSVPLPRTYVASGAEVPHQSAPFTPSAVRPSAHDRPLVPVVPVAVERLMVDRSREALLDALVAAGWSTTQIRGLLRGANDAIGAEVEAARARLAAPRATPLAGRQLADGVEFRD